MDKRLRKQAALYTIISIVDANNGSVILKSDKIRRIFNDDNDIVMVEYASGEVGLAADVDIDTLESVIYEWRDNHPIEFDRLMK